MSILVQEQFPLLLAEGLRMVFEEMRDSIVAESMIPVIFNEETSSKAEEKDLGLGGITDWKEYKGAIEYVAPETGYPTSYIHTEYVQGITIERRLLDDDLYRVMNTRVRQLAMSAVRTKEKHAADIFNNAFSSAVTGGDGVELCGAHPLSPTNSSTQSNTGTAALTYDNIVATAKLMRLFTDDTGNLVSVHPDTILVPPGLEDTAWTAVNSMLKPGTANNDANFVRSRGYNVLVWDYLTDTNNWFMIDSALAKLYLNWFTRIPLEFEADPTGSYQLGERFRGYMRYSRGWSDWRWIYGQAVS